MKINLLNGAAIFMTIVSSATTAAAGDFMEAQKKYPRVRAAIREKEAAVDGKLRAAGLESGGLDILMVAYKAEKKLEIYGRNDSAKSYKLVAVYDICASSGKPGPKRKKGDGQIPEGFYHIDRFNPASKFHLSLGISYPNKADMVRSGDDDPGGEIFIHGSCATIGCLPMTDDKIREIYLFALYARDGGQRNIPVYIFPFRMTGDNFSAYRKKYGGDEALIRFWENLKTGYDLFVQKHEEVRYAITGDGEYSFR